uniref:Uncharacterized protein n=1 Tax=Rhizophora mucronata TaxID=61149 RepID=A0A2P2N5N2_RHIMU
MATFSFPPCKTFFSSTISFKESSTLFSGRSLIISMSSLLPSAITCELGLVKTSL